MKRLFYLDNLRVFLTMLVVVFHTSIAYGGSGSWYYVDFDTTHGVTAAMVVFTIFTVVCQAFFMSLFFFVSAYFTPASYDRKGPIKFLLDRFVRLGIPLFVFYFIIDPPTIWYVGYKHSETLFAFYQQHVFSFKQTFFGPTWFIETLIYFAVIYTLIRLFAKREWKLPFPNGKTLFVTAILFGLIAFVVRLKFPAGTGPMELQLGYFPLYILMMTMGVVAYRNHWLDQIPQRLTKVWKWIAISVIPVFPIGLILTGALSGVLHVYGGINVQAILYAMWEPFVCFGICLSLIFYFQKRWNVSNRLSKELSSTAYTVYIIHPPIVIAWTMLFHKVTLPEITKFLIVAPLGVVTCFLAAYAIYKIPYAKKVL